jgi:hypothetical protein
MCVVGRKAPWYHAWKIVAVQAAIHVPEQCYSRAPSLASRILQDAQTALLGVDMQAYPYSAAF